MSYTTLKYKGEIQTLTLPPLFRLRSDRVSLEMVGDVLIVKPAPLSERKEETGMKVLEVCGKCPVDLGELIGDGDGGEESAAEVRERLAARRCA